MPESDGDTVSGHEALERLLRARDAYAAAKQAYSDAIAALPERAVLNAALEELESARLGAFDAVERIKDAMAW